MKHPLNRSLFILTAAALLAAPSAGWAMGPLKFFSFQAGLFTAFPSGVSGANSFSGQVAWTPIISAGPIGIRGEVGATLLKNSTGGSFLALNYEALLQLGLLPNISLEVGGGAQTWTKGNGGTAGVLSGGLTFGLVGTIDRVYATFSRFLAGNDVNELKVGVGLVF